jgi:hypothetical protein
MRWQLDIYPSRFEATKPSFMLPCRHSLDQAALRGNKPALARGCAL